MDGHEVNDINVNRYAHAFSHLSVIVSCHGK